MGNAADRVQSVALWVIRKMITAILSTIAGTSIPAAEWAAEKTRQLPRFLWSNDPIVNGVCQGLEIRLDLRDNVQRTFYFTHWYERRYITYLTERLRPEDVFIDVGAHVGIHSLLVARAMSMQSLNGQVVAFEPASDVLSCLQETTRANEVSNIEIVGKALGAEEGYVSLRADPDRFDENDASVRSAFGPGEIVEEVPVTQFDTWFAGSRFEEVNLIKIDVEGFELDVLKGMEQTLTNIRPRIIGVEIRDYILERAHLEEHEVVDFLDSVGYRQVPTADLEGNVIFKPSELMTDLCLTSRDAAQFQNRLT